MIHGIGTDIVDVGRIASAIDKHGERFLDRILTQTEVMECNALPPALSAARFVAKRFAAKEAFSKAFGTGIGKEVAWYDVGIRHDPLGRPLLTFTDALQAKLHAQDIGATHVSIADEIGQVIAFVILEKK